ncbi:MAG: Gfo/Idh/MocA family oxidoreductase, partial [Halothiobacillaceae bacterium]
MREHQISRRSVLKLGAALSIPTLVSSRALGLAGQAPASERVKVGIIGLGGRARSIVNESREIKDMQIVAVCDCFKPAIDRFVKDVGQDQKWGTYEDFRTMIEKEKPDGVMVETTTHARAWIT